ncbi:hypothetical protein Ocin01_11742 [Orchesella cincta]|uniref:Fe2OG dioxygenase domain-containing protein n=1 Tax=Orchesella cincta TaxID=48709 RepID=A0A1D2MPK4_ORCCI|nr:hypothetical protein Ocin01_11742 [Orchesella cincta]
MNVTGAIPIIDLANLKEVENIAEDPEWNSAGDQIRAGLGSVGFLYLTNHGIPENVVSQVFKQSSNFFGLPPGVKLKYKKNTQNENKLFDLDRHFGYQPPGMEKLHPDVSYEHKEIFDWLYGVGVYPDEDLPEFVPSIFELQLACKKLLKTFLRLLAIGLKLDDVDFFLKTCRNLQEPDKHRALNIFRLVHYPPVPEDQELPSGAVRCGEHSDFGFLTFLFQDDVGGLEVKNVNGEWVDATPIPGSVLVNTGDLTEFWTCGILPATPHRIIIPDDVDDARRRKARYSIVFFMGPDTDAVITPTEMSKRPHELERISKCDKEYSTDPVTAYDHMMKRVADIYR